MLLDHVVVEQLEGAAVGREEFCYRCAAGEVVARDLEVAAVEMAIAVGSGKGLTP